MEHCLLCGQTYIFHSSLDWRDMSNDSLKDDCGLASSTRGTQTYEAQIGVIGSSISFSRHIDSLARGEMNSEVLEEECGAKADILHRNEPVVLEPMVSLSEVNKRLWRSDEETQLLLPGLPDEVVLEAISTKLPVDAFLSMSWVSRSWQQVVEKYRARLVIDFHRKVSKESSKE
jgi:hypothetical protein